MTAPLYIFDLDGTLADCTHRLHYIQRDRKDKDWDAFNAACGDDEPIPATTDLFNALGIAGADAEIWTGRSESARNLTRVWLGRKAGIYVQPIVLRMRPIGDYRPDDELKEEWLRAMPTQDRARLAGVFEDRRRVVDMWRRNGIFCFQVAEGDF